MTLLMGAAASAAPAIPVPIATDSRIKTLVYNENDVFTVLTHYGYQCNIEFGQNEEIQTVSLGDRVGWQVIPSGRRLFIRAMEDSSRTNMTVITNKHTYQFDLKSSPTTNNPEEELVYVVRFFYPDQQKTRLAPPPYSDEIASPVPVSAPPPPRAAAVAQTSGYNYNYTFTGPDDAAPLKVFDDGHSTYFKFSGAQDSASISAVGADGKETPLSPHAAGEYVVVDNVAPRFTIRSGDAVVCVYNERYSR
jgi:type IV secretion system protein VirB9